MYKLSWISIIVMFTLMGCANSHFFGNQFVVFEEDTSPYLINNKTNVKVKYYGDYLFKKRRNRKTPDFDKNLHKRMRKNSKMLVDTYTYLEPYVSSRHYWYRDYTYEALLKDRKSYIGNAEIDHKQENENIRAIVYYSLDQEQGDTICKVNYCEYIFPCKEGAASIVFWTSNKMSWLKRESGGVIETLSIGEVQE